MPLPAQHVAIRQYVGVNANKCPPTGHCCPLPGCTERRCNGYVDKAIAGKPSAQLYTIGRVQGLRLARSI